MWMRCSCVASAERWNKWIKKKKKSEKKIDEVISVSFVRTRRRINREPASSSSSSSREICGVFFFFDFWRNYVLERSRNTSVIVKNVNFITFVIVKVRKIFKEETSSNEMKEWDFFFEKAGRISKEEVYIFPGGWNFWYNASSERKCEKASTTGRPMMGGSDS